MVANAATRERWCANNATKIWIIQRPQPSVRSRHLSLLCILRTGTSITGLNLRLHAIYIFNTLFRLMCLNILWRRIDSVVRLIMVRWKPAKPGWRFQQIIRQGVSVSAANRFGHTKSAKNIHGQSHLGHGSNHLSQTNSAVTQSDLSEPECCRIWTSWTQSPSIRHYPML